MPDTVFCTDCRWFIRNEKQTYPKKIPDFYAYNIDERSGTKSPNESYWECSHQSNIGKKLHWWGLERYYKRKPKEMNEKNDCGRFERKGKPVGDRMCPKCSHIITLWTHDKSPLICDECGSEVKI